ncbi:MAG: fused MFS/spermidine synthase, partial [Acidimicrobiia bacterium]|nr:fused MFS/spermidine synthase [Acidimicrobiia bacterium]
FLDDVEASMTDDGIYVINVIDHQPAHFVRSQLKTMADVFDHVAVVAPPDYLSGSRGGNWVLVGSNHPIDSDAVAVRVPGTEVVLVDAAALAWAQPGIVLRDEYAPTDQLLSRP